MLARDKRQVVVMLRWALLIALCFLVIYSRGASILTIASSVVLFLGSNLVLMRLPDRIVHAPLFDLALVLVDTLLITAGLWLCGAAGSDFFFLFFFVVFLSAIGERPELTALGAGLAAAGYLLLLYRGPAWNPAMLLRVPFLFATGLTYGFLVGKAREARARASAAEQALGTMSHEIRSPLSAIIRYSEALRTDRMNNLTAAQQAGIAQINADAVELLELTVQRLAAVVGETPTVEDRGAAQQPASGRGARPAPLE